MTEGRLRLTVQVAEDEEGLTLWVAQGPRCWSQEKLEAEEAFGVIVRFVSQALELPSAEGD